MVTEKDAVAVSDAQQDEGPAPPETRDASVDEVAQLKQRLASLEDSLLRAKADYQNLQRRNNAERAEAILYANADLMKALLAVVDGLQRAIESGKTSQDLKSAFDGVRLVYDDFVKALTNQGLEVIEARGKKFDPRVHEALLMQAANDVPAGTVIEEVARGYQLRDRVLRPAKVIVSKGAEDEAPGGSGE